MKQLVYIITLFLFVSSCVQTSESNGLGGYIDEEDYQNEFIAHDSESEVIEMEVDSLASDTTFIDFTNELIDLLATDKLLKFANHFHPKKGCHFSPYTYISEETVNFTTISFKDELLVNSIKNWGDYDGSGEPIELSIKDYFNRFVYDINYKERATDIHINDNLTFSNTLNNVIEIHPTAEYIEFYYEGTTEYEGMDWSSLVLYIEKLNDTYYLVAVVHNQWTI